MISVVWELPLNLPTAPNRHRVHSGTTGRTGACARGLAAAETCRGPANASTEGRVTRVASANPWKTRLATPKLAHSSPPGPCGPLAQSLAVAVPRPTRDSASTDRPATSVAKDPSARTALATSKLVPSGANGSIGNRAALLAAPEPRRE